MSVIFYMTLTKKECATVDNSKKKFHIAQTRPDFDTKNVRKH